MIGDKLEVIIASFGYPVGLVVKILGVHKDGYFVEGNGIEKLVKFEVVTKL